MNYLWGDGVDDDRRPVLLRLLRLLLLRLKLGLRLIVVLVLVLVVGDHGRFFDLVRVFANFEGSRTGTLELAPG